jgi:signal transduction histidine kinase
MLAEAVEQSADLREAFERQQMILRVSTAIRSELDLDAVLQIAVTEVGKAFNASRCAFYKADMEALIRAAYTYISPDAPPGPFPPIDTERNPYVKTIFAGRPVVVPDLHSDPYFSTNLGMRKIDTRSILAVPVLHQGQVLGSLSVHQAGRVRRWRDEEVTCFMIIADQLAMAIRAAQQYSAAQRKAEELEHANRGLESLDRLKSNLLASVSHELRTPLNDVIAYGSSILDGVFGEVPESARDAVGKILDGGEKLRRMVEQLMDATHLAANSRHADLTEVEYGSLCVSVCQELLPAAQCKGLELRVQVPGDHPHVVGDPERLERAIKHLVGNAIKFTRMGYVELRVHVVEDLVITEVRDTGIGIEREDLAKVFEKFYQVDQGPTREFGGVGLGLYVTERFLSDMGSTITVESTPGAGSTFRFKLPLAR